MEKLVRLNILLSKILSVLLVIFFMIMVSIMMAQVFWRYFLELPLSWSEEIARYIFIIVTYFGAAVAVHEKVHIEINLTDYFINKFVNDEKIEKMFNSVLDILKSIVISVVSIFFSYFSLKYAIEDYKFEQVSTSVGLPLFLVSGSIFLSLAVMAFYALSQTAISITEINRRS